MHGFPNALHEMPKVVEVGCVTGLRPDDMVHWLVEDVGLAAGKDQSDESSVRCRLKRFLSEFGNGLGV